MLAIDPRLGIKITGNSSNNSVGVIDAATHTLGIIVIILTLTLSSDFTSATKTPENNIIDIAAVNTSIPTTLVVVIIVVIIVVIVVIIVIICTLIPASSITCTTILPISIFFIIIKTTLLTTDIDRMADGPGLGTNSAK